MSSQPQDNGDSSSGTPPPNANEGCVGPTSSTAGKASACAGCPNQSACSTGAFSSAEALAAKAREDETLRSSLSGVTHVVLVLSGKGGVGKSTVACQIAHTLSWRGYSVGVLDVDLCGPSAPRMLGVNGREVHKSGSGWTPVYANENLAVMSISFLLPDGDSAVVWRGPRKNGLIKQFLTETDWSGGGGGEDGGGGIDYLIVDTPPGTSDEHISTVQFLQAAMPEGAGVGAVGGAIVVTTPEEVSMADVRKELNFCHKTKVRVLGVVENMASFSKKLSEMKFIRRGVTTTEMDVESSASAINGTAKKDEVTALAEETDCTEEIHSLLRRHCPEVLDLYVGADIFPPSNDGPAGMAARYGVPLMGSLPLDPNLLKACEDGVCFTETYRGGDGGSGSPAVGPLDDLVDRLVKALPVEDAV